MGRTGLLGAALAAALALGACAARDFTREGATQDQFKAEEAACRAQVDEMMRRERNIVDDRQTTLGRYDERSGRTMLPTQMAQRDDSNRSGRLMENCMKARGWTPVKKGP